MPELPEVETIVRTLAPQVTGKGIAKITVLHPKVIESGAGLLEVIVGATIATVFRRGKLLLLGLLPSGSTYSPLLSLGDDDFSTVALPPGIPLFMAFHLKMTGRFFVHPAESAPLKHTRLVLDLVETAPLLAMQSATLLVGRLFFDDMRTFGYCRALRRHDFAAWPFWAKLGPEPLTSSVSMLAKRLSQKRSSIKAALLDQQVVAGVGNIYADEALFRAKIRPDTGAAGLSLARLELLVQSLRQVLVQSIEECGSSIRDYRDAEGNAGAFQNNFFVYGRKGELCRVCSCALVAIRVVGRGTVYCPGCQT